MRKTADRQSGRVWRLTKCSGKSFRQDKRNKNTFPLFRMADWGKESMKYLALGGRMIPRDHAGESPNFLVHQVIPQKKKCARLERRQRFCNFSASPSLCAFHFGFQAVSYRSSCHLAQRRKEIQTRQFLLCRIISCGYSPGMCSSRAQLRVLTILSSCAEKKKRPEHFVLHVTLVTFFSGDCCTTL